MSGLSGDSHRRTDQVTFGFAPTRLLPAQVSLHTESLRDGIGPPDHGIIPTPFWVIPASFATRTPYSSAETLGTNRSGMFPPGPVRPPPDMSSSRLPMAASSR